MRISRWAMVLGLAGAWTASAEVVPVTLIVNEGQALGPAVVSGVEAPFTDGNGRVGFVGSLDNSERFIWWNTGPVFYSSQALPLVLTGGESTMGVSNTGGFIYSPSVDGNDAVYTHGGVLLKKTDPIPSLPGLYSSFNSRPIMMPDGSAYWIGGTATTPNGSTSNRHLFKAGDPTNPNSITRILGGGDVIEGKTVKTSASNFDYWLSDDGMHHIHILDMNVAANEHVYVDGGFVAQEGNPTGQGDNWSTFDTPSININGNYVFSGDTDGAIATDEYLAYNSTIALREGDTVDGVILGSGGVRAASINNLDQVAFIWGPSSGALGETLFLGDGSNLATAARLLAVGDEIDVDGDGIGDWAVADFNASTAIGPGLSLAEDGLVYVEVDLTAVGGGTEFEAILAIPEPATLVLGLLALALRRR